MINFEEEEAGELIAPKKDKGSAIKKVILNFNQADEVVQIYVNRMNSLNIDWKTVSPDVKTYIGMLRMIILHAYPSIKFNSRPTRKKGGKGRKGTKNKSTIELEDLVKKHIDKAYFIKNSVADIIRMCKKIKPFATYSDQKLRRAILKACKESAINPK